MVLQKPIDVAAAVIEKNGMILIARRKKGDALEGKWEFPGGKVREGEEPEECIVREIREELSLEIKVEEFLCESLYSYPDKTIRLIIFRAVLTDDAAPHLKAHDSILWAHPMELLNYDFAPADIPVVRKLVSAFKKTD